MCGLVVWLVDRWMQHGCGSPVAQRSRTCICVGQQTGCVFERLETWVTDCTGHMGNTSRFGGRLRCHGRNNQKWTRGYALLRAGLKASR